MGNILLMLRTLNLTLKATNYSYQIAEPVITLAYAIGY